tara:strand:- start:2429 stop:3013 length:585 start_codon:yes stop_codon:yes gene_type:complete
MFDSSQVNLDQLEIATPRLLLRPVTKQDLDDFHRIITSPGVSEGTLSFPRSVDLEWARNRLEDGIKKMRDGLCIYMHAHPREPGNHPGAVGNIGLDFIAKHNRANLGYMLDETCRGQGYATEMLTAVVDYAFDTMGMHRLCATTFTWNDASFKLLTRVGFSHEGRARQHYYKEGEYIDAEDWGILASDPRPWKD